ncbi:hypothetical protein O9G_004594 [Rozella allomycis CSF55]|uniref:Uncharacterized protein n=1 Tax=Rozella allomycis (strain CSF55) TaxID=988480 RepID=A0A075B2L8_ROZAC|nr:hypothetical protein O9G_004594 [Rozella allomycis CSF55]|eukprot:EPZ36802.1 hypothetical protein O9G_004594 [Rozella allomycis CSF55]
MSFILKFYSKLARKTLKRFGLYNENDESSDDLFIDVLSSADQGLCFENEYRKKELEELDRKISAEDLTNLDAKVTKDVISIPADEVSDFQDCVDTELLRGTKTNENVKKVDFNLAVRKIVYDTELPSNDSLVQESTESLVVEIIYVSDSETSSEDEEEKEMINALVEQKMNEWKQLTLQKDVDITL